MTVTQICYNKVKFLILFNTRFSRYSTFIKTLANQRFTKNRFFFTAKQRLSEKKRTNAANGVVRYYAVLHLA